MNELLLKLLIREDPHENLFSVYEGAIKALGANAPSIEKILRRFERQLLTELGYGMTLTQDVRNNESVVSNALYTYVIGRGAVRINQGDDVEFKITGKALVDIENDALDDPRTLAQYKALMRLVISHHLGRKTLHTRRLFTDLQDEQFIHDKT
jgi:DNA repair protein RecO (recombination protein O)